ncbi:MAG: hypothetical protein OEQ47_18195 [Acidimicrobiia bacterium]|nr:hypothetical protein [Acidimicrobiia bacterium]
MPTIICPQCTTANRPAGLSALGCESCGRTIDPRELDASAEAFVRRQRTLRKRSKSSPGPLGSDEVDEMLEWVLDLPPPETPTDPDTSSRDPRRPIRLLTDSWLWRVAIARRRPRTWLYTDSVVSMGEAGLVIKRYYWPVGRKRIPYAEIRSFNARPLRAWHGQYRVQGIDHLGRWYSRDRHRGEKERAIDLTVGKLIRPVVTPDDIDAVLEILELEITNDLG